MLIPSARAEPDPAPDFTIPMHDGTNFTLSDYRGQVVVLDFMFVGCGSCEIAEAGLKTIHAKYEQDAAHAGEFEMISISPFDNPSSLGTYRQDRNIPWSIGTGYSVPNQYGVQAYVTILVVDRDGYMTWRFTPSGVFTDSSAMARDLDRAVADSLAGTAGRLSVAQISIIVLIALAALSSFFSPCSFPLLPGYMTHYLQLEAKRYRQALATTARVEPQPSIQRDMAARAIAAATQDLAMPGSAQELRVILSAADRAFVAGEFVIALELAMMARGDLSRRAGIEAARENLKWNDYGSSLRRTEDLAREAEALNIPVPKTREILQLASAALVAGDNTKAAQLTAQAIEELERERDAGIAANLKTYEEAVAAAQKSGAAVLPAQQALEGARRDLQAQPPKRMGLGKAALGGLAAGLGMVLVYGIVGAIVIVAGAGAASTMPFIQPIVGIVLIALGFLTLTSRQFYFLSTAVEKFRAKAFGNKEDDKDRYYTSLFAYGAGYGAAGFGCVAGPFVAASLQASALGGIGLGILAFLFYAVCVIILMVAITVILSAAGAKAVTKMNRYTDIIKKVSAVVLIAAGAYLVYFFMATRA